MMWMRVEGIVIGVDHIINGFRIRNQRARRRALGTHLDQINGGQANWPAVYMSAERETVAENPA